MGFRGRRRYRCGDTVVAQEMIGEIRQFLRRHVVLAADHQRLAAWRIPESLRHFGDLALIDWAGRKRVPRRARAAQTGQFVGQPGSDQSHRPGGHGDAPVRIASGQRHPRLELHVVREPLGAFFEAPSRTVAGGVFHRRDPRTQKIGPQPDDRFRLVEAVARDDSSAVCAQMRVSDGRRRDRIVGHVTAVPEPRQKTGDRFSLGWTGNRVGEEPHRSA